MSNEPKIRSSTKYEVEADVKRATSWHELKARAEAAERERDAFAKLAHTYTDEINEHMRRIATLERERDEALSRGGPGWNDLRRDLIGGREKAEDDSDAYRSLNNANKARAEQAEAELAKYTDGEMWRKAKELERERDEALAIIEECRAEVALWRVNPASRPLDMKTYEWCADRLEAALEGEKR